MEDEDEDYKLCHKLTEAHVKNFKKMKVSIATQTFSKRVAAVTKCFARNGKNLVHSLKKHIIH